MKKLLPFFNANLLGLSVRQAVFCTFLLIFSPAGIASDNEDAAPKSDLGLSTESAPEDSKLKIPVISFAPLDGKPIIDGHLDDEFWKQAHKFSLDFELYPTRLAPAVVETQAWVGVTKTHVYVAFNAFDPDPTEIRSALRERDATKEDDYVSIIIDPTGTLAKKYEFRVNPHGTLSDIVQDTISERYIYDWDTEWDGAGKIHDKGYSVEIAIPVKSIRSPANVDIDHKGVIILKRTYPRRVDRTLATFLFFKAHSEKRLIAKTTLSTIDLSALNIKNESPVMLTPPSTHKEPKLSVKEVKPIMLTPPPTQEKDKKKKKLTLVPHYIYHPDEKRSIGGEFKQVSEHNVHEVGIDAEYQFDSSKSLAITINPNFTDVESDIARQSINNPFVVFKPEKRRFFKSSAEYYTSLIPTVYTRNIIQPEWGMSYVRDDIHSSLAGFAVDDQETEVVIPDTFGSDKVELLENSQSAAVRYRYSKDKRTIGAMGTFRTADGYHNSVIGADGLLDLGIDDKFRYQLLYSDTQYPQRFAEDLCEEDDCTTVAPPVDCPLGTCSTNAQVLRADYTRPLTGHALQVRYKHDGPESLYWVGYEDIAPDFRADLGLQKRVDIRSLNLAYGRKFYLETFDDDEGKSRIRTYAIFTDTRSYEDSNQIENALSFWGEFRGSYQSVLRFGKRFRERAVNRINQNSLETGSNAPLFDENYWQWYFETSPWTNITLNLDGRIGEIADSDNMVLGDMLELKPRISFRLDNLQFMLSLTSRDFDVDNDRLYKETFVSFTTIYRKNKRFSHRFLYLNDLTERDTARWLGVELSKEREQTLEYTFTYNPDDRWAILAGVKFEEDFKSDVNDSDITNREIYTKIERKFYK